MKKRQYIIITLVVFYIVTMATLFMMRRNTADTFLITALMIFFVVLLIGVIVSLLVYTFKSINKIDQKTEEYFSSDKKDFKSLKNYLEKKNKNSWVTNVAISARLSLLVVYMENEDYKECEDIIFNNNWGRFYPYKLYYQILLCIKDDKNEEAIELNNDLQIAKYKTLVNHQQYSANLIQLIETGTCDFESLEKSVFPIVQDVITKYKNENNLIEEESDLI